MHIKIHSGSWSFKVGPIHPPRISHSHSPLTYSHSLNRSITIVLGHGLHDEGAAHIIDALVHPNGPKGITVLDLSRTCSTLSCCVCVLCVWRHYHCSCAENSLGPDSARRLGEVLIHPEGPKHITDLNIACGCTSIIVPLTS